jgi:hypothetical protein
MWHEHVPRLHIGGPIMTGVSLGEPQRMCWERPGATKRETPPSQAKTLVRPRKQPSFCAVPLHVPWRGLLDCVTLRACSSNSFFLNATANHQRGRGAVAVA